ncbi:MAG: hypothetical protein H0X39_12015 [Actinobacteria bacterium]|nr:hypothetical protein [Actinomycetota bacterium]
MIWLGWRQQRTELLITAVIVAVIALLIVPTGLHMASVYDHDGLGTCNLAHPSSGCGHAIGAFTARFDGLNSLLAWLTLAPGIGVVLAAPFVLDLEQGTFRLAWTQSISRTRWIVVKLALSVTIVTAVALLLTQLLTWWHQPLGRFDGRMGNNVFDSEGTVVFGYALFALGLALAIGVVWRRAVAATAVSFVVYVIARVFVDTWLRQRLLSPSSITWNLSGSKRSGEPTALHHAWVLNEFPSDRFGHQIPFSALRCAGSR